jgi:hypothetical protein
MAGLFVGFILGAGLFELIPTRHPPNTPVANSATLSDAEYQSRMIWYPATGALAGAAVGVGTGLYRTRRHKSDVIAQRA